MRIAFSTVTAIFVMAISALSLIAIPTQVCQSDDNGSWVSGGFFDKNSISKDFTIRNNRSQADENAEGYSYNESDNIADDTTDNDEQQATFAKRNVIHQPNTPATSETLRSSAAAKTTAKQSSVDAAALKAQEDRLANNEFEQRRAALSNPVMRRSLSLGQAKAERLKRQYENMGPDEIGKLLPRYIRQDQKEERVSAKRWSNSFLSDRQTSNAHRARVSLIVAAEPVSELKEAISELVSLRERSRIYVGEVLIVGVDKVMKTDEKKFALASQKIINTAVSSLSGTNKLESLDNAMISQNKGYETLRSFLEKTGFVFSSFVSSENILRKYKVLSSPTWIVSLEQRGSQESHVLQGRPTMGGLFTTDGAFLPVTEQRAAKAEVEKSGEAKEPTTTQTTNRPVTQMYQPFSFQSDRAKVVQHESPYRGTAQFTTDKADYIYRYLPDVGLDESE